jgi:glycosyltransferase involved in cell wall biosynthesis
MIEVSIIIPCRNEKDYIAGVLDSILANDFPKEKLEVIVADGMSEDGTRFVIEEYAAKFPFIHLVDNPKKIVPCALNEAIRNAKGRIIMRMDAHAVYPPSYISRLISALGELKADNVGAAWETLPGGPGLVPKAIALALSHPFGVGNATYRLSNGEDHAPIETDTVPFGCYRKDVFDRIGLFDEELVRNQDNELNERLKKAGGRIFLIPEVKIQYFARKNFSKLWKMFYQYGYFGPLVDKKLGKPTRLRRYIPLFFVCSLTLPWLFMPISSWSAFIPLFSLSSYSLANFLVSLILGTREKEFALILPLSCSLLVSHLSYGFGHFKGILDFWILRKNIRTETVALSR